MNATSHTTLPQDAIDTIAESTLDELKDIYTDASRILWDKDYCRKMGLKREGKAWQLQVAWVELIKARLRELQRPTLEQCIAARDMDMEGYACVPLVWEVVSDEEADKEWTDCSLNTYTFRLVNHEEVLKSRQEAAKLAAELDEDNMDFYPDVELHLVSYGFNKDKTAATCYLS